MPSNNSNKSGRRTKAKANYEPLYITTARSLSRGRERLARSTRDFWQDLTLARGSKYYRALAVFCVLCMIIGISGSFLWRSSAVQGAMDRYREVFLGRGDTFPGESPPIDPPSGSSSGTPPVGTAPTSGTGATGTTGGGTVDPTGSGAGGTTASATGGGASGGDTTAATGGGSPAPAARPDLTTMVRPVTGPVLLGYGWQFSTTMNDWRYHAAVDLQVAEGTAVRAALAGTVVSVGDSFELGLHLIIDHGGGIKTVYGSLKSASAKAGQAVAKGQEIGKAGISAETESASGPHLHFELLDGQEQVDPTPYLQ